MKLRVRNFGPIRSADVEVKPLTVFVGPSNTGKSYLAMLVYSFTRAMQNHQLIMMSTYGTFHRAFSKKTVKEICGDDGFFARFVRRAARQCAKAIRESWRSEAVRYFGEEWKKLSKTNGAQAHSVEIADDAGKIPITLFAEQRRVSVTDAQRKNLKDALSGCIKADMGPSPPMGGSYPLGHGLNAITLSQSMAMRVMKWFSFLPPPPKGNLSEIEHIRHINSGIRAHYLPASRGSAMQGHRAIIGSLIEESATAAFSETKIPPLTGATADFLQRLHRVVDDRPDAPLAVRPDAVVRKLSEKIENDILRGKIKVYKSPAGDPIFRYAYGKNAAQEMLLMRASSAVSELAPIVLYIRHYISPGDIFIVEEPEAHLHPAAQREIAGILAELVNAGVYVVITTHSDVVLEQIGNFMHAHELPKGAKAKALGGITLPPEKVGVYSFSPRPKGTQVKEFAPHDDTGILTDDHLDVSSDLYNETVDLFNSGARYDAGN